MDLPNLGTNPELDDIMQRARDLDIEENLLDLAMYGFTVVAPDKMGTADLVPRLRDAILGVYERRSGHKIDDWQTYDGKIEKFQSWGWLLEDEAFLEAIHNPVYQTIGQFLTGKSGFLAGAAVILKSQQQEFDLPLHSDSHGVPPPWPSFATYANLSWLLTDYLSAEDGPTVLVPGSQRFGRMPRGDEAEWWVENAPVAPISLTGKAGSLAIWHGSLWHGSRPRTTEGMRITLPFVYARSYMQPIHSWTQALAENDNARWLEKYPELSKVLGLWHPYPTDRDGPEVPQERGEDTMHMMGVGDNIYA